MTAPQAYLGFASEETAAWLCLLFHRPKHGFCRSALFSARAFLLALSLGIISRYHDPNRQRGGKRARLEYEVK